MTEFWILWMLIHFNPPKHPFLLCVPHPFASVLISALCRRGIEQGQTSFSSSLINFEHRFLPYLVVNIQQLYMYCPGFSVSWLQPRALVSMLCGVTYANLHLGFDQRNEIKHRECYCLMIGCESRYEKVTTIIYMYIPSSKLYKKMINKPWKWW